MKSIQFPYLIPGPTGQQVLALTVDYIRPVGNAGAAPVGPRSRRRCEQIDFADKECAFGGHSALFPLSDMEVADDARPESRVMGFTAADADPTLIP